MTNTLRITLMTIWLVLLIFLADGTFFNSRGYNYIVYGKDCKYEIPKEYHLGKLGDRYVIYKEDYGKHYLTSYSTAGLDFMYPEINEPSTFADTCAAKGALKAYIKSIQPLQIEEITK